MRWSLPYRTLRRQEVLYWGHLRAGRVRSVFDRTGFGAQTGPAHPTAGLKAKPIIDIMPVVKDLVEVDKIADRFERIDYEYLGEFGLIGRRYLQKGGDERTHQIHIFQTWDTNNIERHIAVRDYLREHKDIAEQYGELKTKLALQYPYDIEGYCDVRLFFVRQVEKDALNWMKNSVK